MITSFWQLLFPFHGHHDMYDMFLNFKNTDLQSEMNSVHFLSFKRSNGNISLQLFVLFLIIMFIATRYWFIYSVMGYATNPYALVAIVFATVTVFLLISSLFLRLSLISFTHSIRVFRWLHPITMYFYNSSFGHCLDDGAIICAAFTSGFFLLSQVISQHLNSITPDVLFNAFNVIIVFQMIFQGMSRIGLLCAWTVTVVCINISLGQVGTSSSEYIWLNGQLLLLLILTYEIERQTLCQFIMSVRLFSISELQERTAILHARDNSHKHLMAKKGTEALALTAKLLAAARETEKIAAYSAEKALLTTTRLLSDENENVKLIAAAEAKAASISAAILAAASDLRNEEANTLAKTLANTGSFSPPYSSLPYHLIYHYYSSKPNIIQLPY